VRTSVLVLTAAVLLAAASSFALTPPPQVLLAIEQAGRFNDTFVGSYRLTINAVVSKTNGTVTDEDRVEMGVSRGADGVRQETIVRVTKNGKDATAEARAEQEKNKAKGGGKTGKKEKKDSDGGLSVGLTIPESKTAGHFVYQMLPGEQDACRIGFAPTAEHQKDEGISKGEIAWRCETLEPLWVIAEPVEMPSHVSEMKARIELARLGDSAYISRLITDGAGGFLLIKRKFHMVVEISGVTPAAVPTAPGAVSSPH
jgi:hypothetical protein